MVTEWVRGHVGEGCLSDCLVQDLAANDKVMDSVVEEFHQAEK